MVKASLALATATALLPVERSLELPGSLHDETSNCLEPLRPEDGGWRLNDSFFLPVPEVFSCQEGPHFDATWGKFRAAASFRTESGGYSDEASARAGGLLGKWLPVWEERFQSFFDVIVPWAATRPSDGSHLFRGLENVDREQRSIPLPKLGGLCVYGLVMAMHVLAVRETSDKPPDFHLGADTQNWEFVLDRAWLLLGKDLEFDFLTSSLWPVTSFQIAALRLGTSAQELEDMKLISNSMYKEYATPMTSSSFRAWNSADKTPSPVSWHTKVDQVSIALFGWHASLLLEIATSLERALQPWSVELQYFGAYYPTRNVDRLKEKVPEGVGSRVVAAYYRTWIEAFLDSHAAWDSRGSVEQGLEVLEMAYLHVFEHATFDVHLCVTPLWFCMVIALVKAQARILIYFDDLPDMVPSELFEDVALFVRKAAVVYVSPSSRGPDASSAVALVASSPLVAALGDRLLGLRAPVASWSCWYVADLVKWNAPNAPDVFLLRADLWFESTPGRTWYYIFHIMLAESNFPFGIQTMLPPTNDNPLVDFNQLWNQAANHSRAAIFMPDDMAKMIFWEACSMGLPIWTPSQEQLARMLPFFTYYHFSGKHLTPQVRRASATWGRQFPVEPFGLSVDLSAAENRSQRERMQGPIDALFWAGMSDFVSYPHVQRFDSISHLMVGILACDLQGLSSRMLEAHAQRAETGAMVWREAFSLLLRT
ncbi:unnamed protein product [Polarella glacialis]|uniref:Uncharacterized protein n=1 Tax=Polarella glacialis TaxID=89957 RepID=A0A813EFS9_POLGL|nr:unnamed protein product [Polarella glacialis]